jgi:putative FmdB family regulatory protein
MPTYEYQCQACGNKFEKFQSITAAPIKKCPACGKSKVKRLISAGAGLLFKGGGFYITDYRPDSYNKAAKADAPAGETTGEAKPAADTSKTEATPKADAKPKSEPKSEPKPVKKESNPSKKS